MSGIAGLLSLDGGPIDGHLLSRLTESMQFRGPDARETWDGGRVGFGHAMLRATFESQHERQPCSLDGRVWIVADARVDGQSELCQKLRSAGHDCRQSTNDAELILQAYRAWGDDCVRHLLGDFAFAIWDGPRTFSNGARGLISRFADKRKPSAFSSTARRSTHSKCPAESIGLGGTS